MGQQAADEQGTHEQLDAAAEASEGAGKAAPAPAESGDAIDWTRLPEWVPEPLREAWQLVISHPLLGAAAVILVSLVLAKVVDLFVTQVLKRLTARTRSDVDDQLLAKMHRPVFLTVFFFGLIVATHVLQLPPTADSPSAVKMAPPASPRASLVEMARCW